MYVRYGDKEIEVPVRADVLVPAITNSGPPLTKALQAGYGSPPLAEELKSALSVTLVVPDDTRPAAHLRIIPALRHMLQGKRLTLLVASGAHTAPGENYLRTLADLLPGSSVCVHDCDTSPQVHLGTTARGTPVVVNRALVETDLLLGVGSVAIHPFAGLSGGPKHFVPGCAGRITITHNHSLLLLPGAMPGTLEGNPLYEDLLEAAAMLSKPLLINESLSPDGKPLGYYYGQIAPAHAAASQLALQAAIAPFDEPYDLVIASAGGMPRDINLYQAIKALEMAALACRDGGRLILLAECREGIGSALYEEWAQKGPQAQADMVRTCFQVGAHKAFLASRALSKLAGAVLVSELAPQTSLAMGFIPANSLAEALQLLGGLPGERTAVIPYATASLPSSSP